MEEEFKLYVLFNSKTKKITSFTFDISVFPKAILDNLLYKEYSFKKLGITDENINLNRFKWIGDYETGRLVDIVSEKKAIVTENELEEKYESLFNHKYNTKDIIYELILNCDMKTENGINMQNFLKKLLDRKKNDIEYFKNSDIHIWETREETQNQLYDAFKV
jgi:hypothetical protein